MRLDADRRGLRRLISLLGDRRGAVAGVAVATLASVVSPTLSPLLIGAAVDAVQRSDEDALKLVAVALAGLGVLAAVGMTARTLLAQRLALDIERDLRSRFIQRLLRMDLDALDRYSKGDLTSRGTVDLRQLRSILGTMAPSAVQSIATIAAVAVVMVVSSPPLAAAALAPLPVMVAVGARYSRTLRDADFETRSALGELAGQVEEDVAGIAVIKGFAHERDRYSRFRGIVSAARSNAMSAARLEARFGSIIGVLPGAGMLAVLALGGVLAVNGVAGVTDAKLVAFFTYVVVLVGPAQQVGWILGTGQRAVASADRVLELIEPDPDPPPADSPGRGRSLADEPLSVAARGLTASYGADGAAERGEPVLRDVGLHADPGETLAVAGPAGSGKSTLLAILNRLHRPERGTIELAGTDLETVEESELRSRLASVADPSFLFAGTIRENIAYGRADATDEEVLRAGRLAAVDAFASSLPDGYETLIGERGSTLSGGQRQRIALARALLRRPRLLLLDNPTASLDRATERSVLDGLAADAAERVTIAATHRPQGVAAADRLLVLEAGKVRAEGPRKEVLAGDPGLERLLGGDSVDDGDPTDAGERPAGDLDEGRAPEPRAGSAPAEEAEATAGRPSARKRLRFLAELLVGTRRRVLLGVGATLVGMLMTIVPPYLGAQVINDVVANDDTGRIALLCGLLAVALAVGLAATAAQILLLAASGQTLLARLRRRLMRHVLALPMRFFDRSSEGALVGRMTNDVEALDQLLTGGLSILISSVLTIVATSVVLVVLNLELALATCAVLPLALAATAVFSARLSSAYHAAAETIGDLTGRLTETIAGMRTIRSFAQQGRHLHRLETLNGLARDELGATVKIQAAYLGLIELLAGLALAGIVLLGGYEAVDGAITIGTLVAFTTYLRTAIAPIPSLVGLYDIYAQGVAGLDRVMALLDEPTLDGSPGRSPRRAAPVPPDAALALEDVSFAYDDRGWALDSVSLEIPAGSSVAVVGRTGAGKSTLLKLLLRFYDPGRGRVTLGGRDLRELPRDARRAQVGYVTQEPFLFSGTVWENIAFASADPSVEVARRAADAAGVLDALERLPRGLETVVGSSGDGISAGQRQLIALARAALGNRPILILDEPTSSVDPVTEESIRRALDTLRKNRTTVTVAHRLSTIRSADRIVVIERGRIVESGSHDDLLATGGVYSTLIGA